MLAQYLLLGCVTHAVLALPSLDERSFLVNADGSINLDTEERVAETSMTVASKLEPIELKTIELQPLGSTETSMAIAPKLKPIDMKPIELQPLGSIETSIISAPKLRPHALKSMKMLPLGSTTLRPKAKAAVGSATIAAKLPPKAKFVVKSAKIAADLLPKAKVAVESAYLAAKLPPKAKVAVMSPKVAAKPQANANQVKPQGSTTLEVGAIAERSTTSQMPKLPSYVGTLAKAAEESMSTAVANEAHGTIAAQAAAEEMITAALKNTENTIKQNTTSMNKLLQAAKDKIASNTKEAEHITNTTLSGAMGALTDTANQAEKAERAIRHAATSEQMATAKADSDLLSKNALAAATKMKRDTNAATQEIMKLANITSQLVQQTSAQVLSLQSATEKNILAMGSQVRGVGSVAGSNLKAKDEGQHISESAAAADAQINTLVTTMKDERLRANAEFNAAGKEAVKEMSDLANSVLSKGSNASTNLEAGAYRGQAGLASASAKWQTAQAEAVTQVARVAKKGAEASASKAETSKPTVESSRNNWAQKVYILIFAWLIVAAAFTTYHYYTHKFRSDSC